MACTFEVDQIFSPKTKPVKDTLQDEDETDYHTSESDHEEIQYLRVKVLLPESLCDSDIHRHGRAELPHRCLNSTNEIQLYCLNGYHVFRHGIIAWGLPTQKFPHLTRPTSKLPVPNAMDTKRTKNKSVNVGESYNT
ncbi:hypothetical protein LXL04_011837 [Taraxacum kok-saghyz]